MANFFPISPIGYKTPDLISSLYNTFKENGHRFVSSLEKRDVVFFDCHTRLFDYYQPILDQVLSERLPIVSFCEFDFGGMSKEVYPAYTPQQQKFFDEANRLELKIVHFVRKMDKTIKYPPNVFPYEKCIMNDFPLVSKEELFSRHYDFCWIGNESPQRKNVVNGLLDTGFKGYVHWTNEKGKLPHDEWLNLHRQAKFFLSCDGGGYGDERSYQLITTGCFLKNRNNHLQSHPFKQAIQCVEVDENISDLDKSNFNLVLSDKNWLYSMYLNGVDHMKAYYTEEYRANYILYILKQNDITLNEKNAFQYTFTKMRLDECYPTEVGNNLNVMFWEYEITYSHDSESNEISPLRMPIAPII